MTHSTQQRQRALFELDLAGFIKELLGKPQQPSAEELVNICAQNFGEKAKEEIKESVLQLLNNDNIARYKKEYLWHLIEDRSLDKAIAGDNVDQLKINILDPSEGFSVTYFSQVTLGS